MKLCPSFFVLAPSEILNVTFLRSAESPVRVLPDPLIGASFVVGDAVQLQVYEGTVDPLRHEQLEFDFQVVGLVPVLGPNRLLQGEPARAEVRDRHVVHPVRAFHQPQGLAGAPHEEEAVLVRQKVDRLEKRHALGLEVDEAIPVGFQLHFLLEVTCDLLQCGGERDLLVGERPALG
jgi:hypothetical protein